MEINRKYRVATAHKDGRIYLDDIYQYKNEAEEHAEAINKEDGVGYWCVIEEEF